MIAQISPSFLFRSLKNWKKRTNSLYPQKLFTEVLHLSDPNQLLMPGRYRLRKSGYPFLLLSVSEALLGEIHKDRPVHGDTKEMSKTASISYVHSSSHRLKKTARRAGVNVFAAQNRIAGFCRKVNSNQQPPGRCTTRHRKRFTSCRSNVVYDIPLSCCKLYNGETSRCVNERHREHIRKVKNSNPVGGNLASSVISCGCMPSFRDVSVRRRYRNRTAKIFLGAFQTKENESLCVSSPSINGLHSDVRYLKS